MRILVTGGCGFIGSNLSLAFQRQGHEIVCFDNLARKGSELLAQRVTGHGCSFVRGDIRNTQDLDALNGVFDLLVECSAEPSVLAGTRESGARFMIDNNLTGSVNCFEFARQRRVPVLFLSTSRVYPHDRLNALKYDERETRYECVDRMDGLSDDGVTEAFPLEGVRSLYGATKLCSELLLREYSAQFDLPSLITRFGVVAGPWQLGKTDQGVFTYWMAAHYYGKPLTYIGFGGRGKQVRDVLHIDDLVDLLLRQAQRVTAYRGQVFNAGGSTVAHLSLAETTDLCRLICGRHVPLASVIDTRPADVVWYISDNSRASSEFGWRPTRDAEQILRDIHAWLCMHGEEFKGVLA